MIVPFVFSDYVYSGEVDTKWSAEVGTADRGPFAEVQRKRCRQRHYLEPVFLCSCNLRGSDVKHSMLDVHVAVLPAYLISGAFLFIVFV